ncbi:sulfatase family protein [Pontiella sulfatireligans]|uniref:Arylsulfatase n=1 Tax=Pontiella sulfatireligans TaxID=2750658 RepID=A0A6C2UTC5_9BACT|nr:sulfatase [Pontiella sulfatireligans]SPS74555.1 sulfatase S1_11 [Kiritimatiellales bacterium]VGO23223.1 Arylsulfatase [Pontiella sulfatireligans]
MLKKVILRTIVLWGAGAAMALQAAPENRPNILWIFSDDHSIQTIGSYGGRLQKLNPTPNLDRIAKEGMRFDRCYVGNSICAPSRATLLTGKHSHLHGKIDNQGGFNHNQQQFQKILQKNGYQTAMIGKIHLNGKMQGFDHWEVLPGQGDYYQPNFISGKGMYTEEGYVTDIITDKALKWLDSGRDKDKPFMVMIHHKAAHRSWMPALRHVGMYENLFIPEPDSLFDDYATRGVAAHSATMTIRDEMRLESDLKLYTPKSWEKYEAEKKKMIAAGKPFPPAGGWEFGAYFRMTPEQRKVWDDAREASNQKILAKGEAWLKTPEGVKWRYQRYMKDYLGCIASLDENIGRVLDYLAESGLDKNTIVMYSSDQGFYMGEHGWFDKRFMYEESFRTPLIAYWPGHIKPGSVNTDLVQNIDFAETFLDLAGAPVPDDMQGRSLVPLLAGKTPKDWRESLYYHYYEYPAIHNVRRHEGVFNGRFKLIRFYGKGVPNGEEWELFDIEKDPEEMNNVYGNPEYTAKIAELKKELQRLREVYEVPEDTSGE